MYGDLFCTPPVRYLGYAFAIFEAMKNVLRTKPEKTFYVVGSIFIFLHAVDNAVESNGAHNMVMAFIDTLLFEAVASVAIPVCVAKAAYEVSNQLLLELNIHYQVTRYGPPFLALLAILLISQPLDNFTQKLLSKTIRPLYP